MFRRALLAAAFSAALITGASAATVHYAAHLTGHKEVPPTDSKGKGLFDGTFDTTTKVLSYKLTFEGLTGPATAAHIHGPATRKANAGVIAPLGGAKPTSPVTGTVTLTDDQVKMLHESKLYVNVHTAANKAGEIRGQIYRVRTKKTAPAAAPK